MQKKSFRKPRKIVGGVLGPLVLLAVLPAPANAYPRPGITERISVASDGTEAEGGADSISPSFSTDGRYVAFSSDASNLVPGDTNGGEMLGDGYDAFVRDRVTGATERVSVASDGAQANGNSFTPALSGGGRYVAFSSYASNLTPGDTNRTFDVFVHDRETGTNERVSVASDGTEANANSGSPLLAADGRYVAFWSNASNLVPGDTNGATDVFVRDRDTGSTERVSVASDGAQANGFAGATFSFSADGGHVTFYSPASNLVPGDSNDVQDIFVHDRATGATERVSVGSDGAEAASDSGSPSISADGRYVAFWSDAANLIPGDTNAVWDVFVHDRATGATERVSVASDGTEADAFSHAPGISADGRHVTFYTAASNLVPGITNGVQDVFVHDRATGATERVSVASDGTEANFQSHGWFISPDGRHVAFASYASNLVPGDTNEARDVFVHDRGDPLGVVGPPSVVKAPGGVNVSGRVTLSGATLAGATDPGDDATTVGAADLGAELTGASLIYRPEQEDLLLRLGLASLPGGATRICPTGCVTASTGAGAPGVLYGLELGLGTVRYEVRALRVAGTALPPAGSYAALYRCAPDCTEHARLTGTFGTTGVEVRVSVPLSALESAEGTELTGLRAFTAAGEATPGALLPLDEVRLSSSVIPASRVELGIAPAETPEDQVAFTVKADLLAGAFSGIIPTDGLSAGSYRVGVRACLGDVCGPAAFDEVAL